MIIRVLQLVGVAHREEITPLSPAQQRVVAVLAAAGPTGLSADAFADELWPHDLPTGWQSSVRMAISRMRRAVPPDSITTGGRRYALNLTIDEVDLWQLLNTEDLDLGATSASTLSTLLAGAAYPDMDSSPLLAASTEQIMAARTRLLERLANENSLKPQVLEAARSLASSEPYREDVLAAVARLHANAGWELEASRLLEAGIDRLETDLGLPASERLRDLLKDLDTRLRHSRSTKANRAITTTPSAPRFIGSRRRESSIGALRRETMFTSASARLAEGGLIITGEPGSGKTVLGQRVAEQASLRGDHVVWLTARRNENAVYGAVLATLPMLRPDLAPLLVDGGSAFDRTRCWTAVVDTLCSELPERPISLFVDDAQWLDSHAQRFIEFLAGTQSSHGLRLTVIGRADSAEIAWQAHAETLARSGFSSITTTDFDRRELVELIGIHHPRSTSRQRADLADHLVTNKAALPAIAVEILKSTNTRSLVAPNSLFGGVTAFSADTVWARAVSEPTRQFAAAAALVGVTFRIGSVARLVELPIGDAAAAVDELLDAELVSAEQRPDEFSFRHVLVQTAFEATLDRALCRKLHLAAARLARSEGDVHRRARHLYAAGVVADNEVLVATLVESARDHQQRGLFREAIEAFTLADQVAAEPLNPTDLLAFANVLDRGGSDGYDVRHRSFKAAVETGDHELSVAIALGGAAETESVNGDPRRVEMLSRVRAEQVPAETVRTRDIALARELGLLGRHDEAFKIGARLAKAASTPDEAAAAWLSVWASRVGRPLQERDPLPAGYECVTDPELRAHLHQVRCLRSFTVGDHDEALHQLADLEGAPATRRSPLRAWYAQLLRAMAAFVDGDWSAHDAIATRAFTHATQRGIGLAFSARAAQLFAEPWVLGTPDLLLPLLESAAPDVQNSLLAEAALAVALAARPERADDAQTAVADVANRIALSDSPLQSSAAALLATAVTARTDESINQLLRIALDPYLGMAIVVGGGVAHLGPASRALAMLAPETGKRVSLLTQAVSESDNWQLRTWSVRCRLDLAAATGDTCHIANALLFAEGSELAQRMHAHFAAVST